MQRLCDFATRCATVKIQPALFEMTKWQYSEIEDGENMKIVWREYGESMDRVWKEYAESMERVWREYGKSMVLWNGNNSALTSAVHREHLSI